MNSISYTAYYIYKWVFNKVLNDWRESQHLISRGNIFQRVGAATESAQSPSVEVLGTMSKCLSEERRAPTGWYGTRFDIRFYDGESPFNAFHVNISNLKSILPRTASQCKSFKIVVMLYCAVYKKEEKKKNKKQNKNKTKQTNE